VPEPAPLLRPLGRGFHPDVAGPPARVGSQLAVVPGPVPDHVQRPVEHAVASQEPILPPVLGAVLSELAKEGVRPGDRRQHKTVGVVRAFAFLNGADEVRPEHLDVAQHTLWDSPEEQPQKVAQVTAKVANPTVMRVAQLLLEVESVLSGADVRNLAEAAKAAAKLGEVEKQLATLSGNGRVEKARAYVREQLKKLKLASIEAV